MNSSALATWLIEMTLSFSDHVALASSEPALVAHFERPVGRQVAVATIGRSMHERLGSRGYACFRVTGT